MWESALPTLIGFCSCSCSCCCFCCSCFCCSRSCSGKSPDRRESPCDHAKHTARESLKPPLPLPLPPLAVSWRALRIGRSLHSSRPQIHLSSAHNCGVIDSHVSKYAKAMPTAAASIVDEYATAPHKRRQRPISLSLARSVPAVAAFGCGRFAGEIPRPHPRAVDRMASASAALSARPGSTRHAISPSGAFRAAICSPG